MKGISIKYGQNKEYFTYFLHIEIWRIRVGSRVALENTTHIGVYIRTTFVVGNATADILLIKYSSSLYLSLLLYLSLFLAISLNL